MCDGDPVSGQLPRNAQPLWNIGARSYLSLFHDRRVEMLNLGDAAGPIRNPAGADLPTNVVGPLAAQAFFPVTSPIEMAGQYGENLIANAANHENRTQIWDNPTVRVADIPEYLEILRIAYLAIASAEQFTYARILKADGSQLLELQRDALIEAGVDAVRIYEDEASGRKDHQPGLDACMKAFQSGNSLVTWKLDRLGRDLKHLVATVDDLREHGCWPACFVRCGGRD